MNTKEISTLKRRHMQFIYWSSISIDALRFNNSPSIYVLGYIKSGTNWLCNMISSTLDLPVLAPRHRHWIMTQPCIFHMHRFMPISSVRKRTIYLMRDGRDTLVSQYFQIARSKKGKMRTEFERIYKKEINVENIKENLPDFIDYMSKSRIATIDYRTHIKKWKEYKDQYITLRYEDMLNDAEKALSHAINELPNHPTVTPDKIKQAVEKHSFLNVTKRKPGEADNNSFVRKGISGDWRNYFTEESARRYDQYAGDCLLDTGYETDSDWVDKFVKTL